MLISCILKLLARKNHIMVIKVVTIESVKTSLTLLLENSDIIGLI